MFIRKSVKGRQQKDQQEDGGRHGQQGKEHGFSKELPDEKTAGRTYYFSQTYFFCPSYRSGRRQIHKIDTGYQQDKDSHAAEDADILYTTAFRSSIDKYIVQILIAKWLQTHPLL